MDQFHDRDFHDRQVGSGVGSGRSSAGFAEVLVEEEEGRTEVQVGDIIHSSAAYTSGGTLTNGAHFPSQETKRFTASDELASDGTPRFYC